MSAYASLPGSFLPPFFAFGGTSPTKKDDESSECGASSHHEDQRPDRVSMQQQVKSTSSDQKSYGANKTPECHQLPSGCSLPDLSTLELASSESGNATRVTSPASEIIIAINNARVDTVQLIQSLTTRGSNIARRTANFISRSSEPEDKATTACSTTDYDPQTLHSKPSLCYEGSDSEDDDDMSFYDYDDDFTSYESDKDNLTEEHSVCAKPSQDEDAIQFELFINFHGREYKAFRAFSTFVQLRNDLLRDRTVPSTVAIPELPSLSSENYERHSSITGFHALARSGFAMLQATAKMYCPEMERWLRHVVEVVPSSPILNRFLWEPLAASTASWHPDDAKGDDSSDLSGAKPPQPRNKPRPNNVIPSLKYRSKSYNTSLSSITELLDES
eukprot:CCRYP_009009-RA/>CCRYP_009009-RA protein AED:0.44 eAED:0.44 QI:0/-1/0/1/-1/1/1/0/388